MVMEPLTSVPPCHQSCLVVGFSLGQNRSDSQVRSKPFCTKAGPKIEGCALSKWWWFQLVSLHASILQLPESRTSRHHFGHWSCSYG
jgi:hypothetical protein